MSEFHTLCKQFARILGGKPTIKQAVCSVEMPRNLHVTIQGRPSRGELHASFQFESLDNEGNALNLGEIVLLEEEVPFFMQTLVQNGMIISALHNHWMYTNPTILYLHFQSVEPPVSFASKVAEALRALK